MTNRIVHNRSEREREGERGRERGREREREGEREGERGGKEEGRGKKGKASLRMGGKNLSICFVHNSMHEDSVT